MNGERTVKLKNGKIWYTEVILKRYNILVSVGSDLHLARSKDLYVKVLTDHPLCKYTISIYIIIGKFCFRFKI